jgi:D-amino-acid oxidase
VYSHSTSNDADIDPNSPKLWYSTHVQSFALLAPSSNLPNGAQSGLTFTSFAINPTKYLTYLLTRAQNLGARTISAALPTAQGLAHTLTAAWKLLPSDVKNDVIVVNCTGLGARKICDDNAMYPIRGQTVLVRITPPPLLTCIFLHDSTPVTYIVPRTGTDMYFLGGTNDAGDWDALPTPSVIASIMTRCRGMMKGWVAEDAEIEIIKEQVGLRPGRKEGVRVEIENVDMEMGDEKREVVVVHQYGHAGAGYQNSLGSARKVLRLVGEVCMKLGVPNL